MPKAPDTKPTAQSKAIAAVIRSEMGLRQVTQADLVRKTGINQSSLSRLLSGKNVIDIVQLGSICAELRVPVAEMLSTASSLVASRKLDSKD